MELKIDKQSFYNSKVNFKNIEVEFINGIAQVTDELGDFIKKEHGWLFNKKTKVLTTSKDVSNEEHQIMMQEMTEKIAKLNSVKLRLDEKVKSLEAEIKDWKAIANDQIKNKVEDYTLSKIKSIAKDLKVDESLIAKKNKREDWIKAVEKSLSHIK